MDATVLNQQQTVNEIIASLDTYHVVGIAGLPGCGKSFTANLLAENWRRHVGAATVATGDEYQKARRYFPFHQAIAQFSVEREFLRKTASGALAKTATAIPIAGPLAGFVVEKLLARTQSIAKEKYAFLNTEEQNILYQLQHIAGKKRLLLVCDDLQAWDEASLSLLRLLLSGSVNNAYTFLNEVRFVLVRSLKDSDEAPRFDEFIVHAAPVPIWRLGYVAKSEFPAALRLFGLRRDLPDDILDAIYSICGGHLHVARQLVSYLERNESPISRRWLDEGETQFVFRLVDSRLRALGPAGLELLSLLRMASTIGQIFSEHELACLADREVHEVRTLLGRGEALQLVRRGTRFIHFAHTILCESLKHGRGSQPQALNRQFAACLKKLRPGDYRSRSYHMRRAGDDEEAAVLAACSQLRDQRRGNAAVDDEELQLIHTAGLDAALKILMKAYDLAQAYALDEATALLSRIDPASPTLLLAEAGYIRAMCLIKRYRYDTREEAITTLQRWADRFSDEGELVTRLLSTELVALAHQRRQEEALATEAALIDNLRKRVAFDTDARDALVILDRKADLLYAADQAHHRLLRAKEHFMPEVGGQPRDFYQYCASTLNLAANCIMCADYAEALVQLREVTTFLNSQPGYQFARMEVLTNNLIVAELRSGLYGARVAAGHFDSLVERVLSSMDYSLELSNCGACWALAGNLARAAEILAPLYEELQHNSEADEYHWYFAGSNFASVLYLSGERRRATQLFDSLEEQIESVNPPHTSYFRNRHRILRQAMRERRHASPEEWDLVAFEADPAGTGPGWRNYGRGFLLSDIQIWTES